MSNVLDDRVRPFMGFVDYLQARWMDERDYEDFSEYAIAMQTKIPQGFSFVRATQRPFGCVMFTPLGTKVHVYVSGNKVCCKSTT